MKHFTRIYNKRNGIPSDKIPKKKQKKNKKIDMEKKLEDIKELKKKINKITKDQDL